MPTVTAGVEVVRLTKSDEAVSAKSELGTTAHFEGVVMSRTGIILRTGASMKGHALSQTAVILDSNVVTMP